MIFIYGLGVAVPLSILTFMLLRAWLKPVSSRKDKYVERSKRAGRKVNQFTWRETRDSWMSIFNGMHMSDEFREELNKSLDRLESDYRAKDIRQMQMLYTSIYVVASVIAFFIGTFLGIIMLALTYFIWKIPVSNIRKQIKERNDEFIENLSPLYTIIFNQYKRDNSENLGTIVEAFYPTASPLMKKDLVLILRDIDSGEEYALNQLKKRIPSPLILRFCNMIIDNLEGYDNRNVMENFYMELKEDRDRRRRKRMEKKERNLGMVISALYVPLGFLLLVYFVLFAVSSF